MPPLTSIPPSLHPVHGLHLFLAHCNASIDPSAPPHRPFSALGQNNWKSAVAVVQPLSLIQTKSSFESGLQSLFQEAYETSIYKANWHIYIYIFIIYKHKYSVKNVVFCDVTPCGSCKKIFASHRATIASYY
jgi:hypothetical protein